MISIFVVLLIIGACFYLGILYTNTVMLTIGYALILGLAASFMEMIYRLFTLKCHVNVPISMTEAGKPVHVVVKIKNKSILPAGKVEVRLEYKNILQRRGKAEWIEMDNVSVGESRCHKQLLLKGAGCHEIIATHMRIHSITGMITIRKKCKDFSSVLIMPEVYSTNVQVTEAVRNFLGDADVYDDFRPGHDSGETFAIREYREKDKLQSIHWKLSAKMDNLMVKENSLPKACAIVLMLELRSSTKNKVKFAKFPPLSKKKELDMGAYLELAASISYSLMDQKCPHFVAWYSAEKDGIRRIRVDDEESFYLFLDCYLREAMASDKKIREEYRNDYKSEWYLHDLIINEELELFKNGEKITKLEAKKIKDECERLELLF